MFIVYFKLRCPTVDFKAGAWGGCAPYQPRKWDSNVHDFDLQEISEMFTPNYMSPTSSAEDLIFTTPSDAPSPPPQHKRGLRVRTSRRIRPTLIFHISRKTSRWKKRSPGPHQTWKTRNINAAMLSNREGHMQTAPQPSRLRPCIL